MVLLLITLPSPEDSWLEFCNLVMKGLMKAIETHDKHEHARQGGVNQHRPCRLGEPLALPRLDSVLELGHHRPKLHDRKLRITNGDSQVSRCEVPQGEIEAIRDALVARLTIAKNHHFTLGEVDGETRHLLEAQEEEFQVRDVHGGSLNHNNRVICILKKGNPTPRD
jgi:hypothetical protein